MSSRKTGAKENSASEQRAPLLGGGGGSTSAGNPPPPGFDSEGGPAPTSSTAAASKQRTGTASYGGTDTEGETKTAGDSTGIPLPAQNRRERYLEAQRAHRLQVAAFGSEEGSILSDLTGVGAAAGSTGKASAGGMLGGGGGELRKEHTTGTTLGDFNPSPTSGSETTPLANYSVYHSRSSAGFDARPSRQADLYAPLGWTWAPWPLRIIGCVIFLPFIGGFWCYFAVTEKRAGRRIGYNHGDPIIIVSAGLLHFISALLFFIAKVGRAVEVGDGRMFDFSTSSSTGDSTGGWNDGVSFSETADFIGSLIFFPTSILYFLFISIAYKRRNHMANQRAVEIRMLKGAEQVRLSQWVEHTRRVTAVESWKIIPVAVVLGLLMTFVLRMCVSGRDDCSDNVVNLLFSAEYYSQWFPMTMTFFWWTLTSSVIVTAAFGVLLYTQQRVELEAFTNLQQTGTQRAFFQDLLSDFSTDLAVWSVYLEELLMFLNTWPLGRAFIGSNVIFSAIGILLCSYYLAIRNVINLSHENAVAQGTLSTGVMLVYNSIVFGLLIHNTVKIERIIEQQIRSVSAAQNELQRQLDEEDELNLPSFDVEENANKRLQMLSASQVLWDLDTFLQHSSVATPRVVEGISLDSIRWLGIGATLFSLNVFFVALYIKMCRS